jgi:hypothetical protein
MGVPAADRAGVGLTRQGSERERLQRTLADLARRQHNVMRQAQDCEPDGPFGQGLRQTYNNLEPERRTALAAIAELDAAEQAGPPRPTAEDAELLDALPYLTLKLTDTPGRLVQLPHEPAPAVSCWFPPRSRSHVAAVVGVTPLATRADVVRSLVGP